MFGTLCADCWSISWAIRPEWLICPTFKSWLCCSLSIKLKYIPKRTLYAYQKWCLCCSLQLSLGAWVGRRIDSGILRLSRDFLFVKLLVLISGDSKQLRFITAFCSRFIKLWVPSRLSILIPHETFFHIHIDAPNLFIYDSMLPN